MAVVEGGTAPVWFLGPDGRKAPVIHDNPLLHCLMLTAIVVGVSVFAVAIALIINITRAYGTIEEDEILDIEATDAAAREGEER
jgi:multicomponent Na+:H+ antiporter subunit C